MNTNFIIIERDPNSQELLNKIITFFPNFYNYWEQPDNLNKDKKGMFTYHGVFSELSRYFRDNFLEFSEELLNKFFEFIEECVNTDIHSENGLSNAAYTCFLENLAGEGKLSETIYPYLRKNSKEYFDEWNY